MKKLNRNQLRQLITEASEEAHNPYEGLLQQFLIVNRELSKLEGLAAAVADDKLQVKLEDADKALSDVYMLIRKGLSGWRNWTEDSCDD